MRTQVNRRNSHSADEDNPYWISFSDIMAGLLVIFVLAAIALIIELTQKKEEWNEAMNDMAEAEQVRAELLREIEKELNDRNIPVIITDNDTVLRIPDDVLTFRSRSSDIPQDAESRAKALEIGQVLYESIVKGSRWKYLDTVFVEGHTDRLRYYNETLKGNWGLSAMRAISVWDYWNTRLPESQRLDSLRNHMGKTLFSVSGYAETRPVTCTNYDSDVQNPEVCPDGILDEAESLRKNRRIDIRFTVRRPAMEEYKAQQEGI